MSVIFWAFMGGYVFAVLGSNVPKGIPGGVLPCTAS